jgi:hypothetical protein
MPVKTGIQIFETPGCRVAPRPSPGLPGMTIEEFHPLLWVTPAKAGIGLGQASTRRYMLPRIRVE